MNVTGGYVFRALMLCSSITLWLNNASAQVRSDGQYVAREPTATPVQYIVGSERWYGWQYAKQHGLSDEDMGKLFGATGIIRCEGKVVGSANIVGRRDILATNAHVLMDLEQCQARKGCVFETSLGKKTIKRKLVREISSGTTCPGNTSYAADWSVAQLERNVPNAISPYLIGDASAMSKGDTILAVNGTNGDFFEYDENTGQIALDAENKWIRPKSFARCNWGEPSSYAAGLYVTNCSGAILGSGSSVLNSKNEIVAIFSASTETKAEVNAALQKEKDHPGSFASKRCDFSPSTCASFHKLIEGEFLHALRTATSAEGSVRH